MNQDRWERTKAIFTSALDLDPAAREPFVREAAAGDQDLCREVLSLLAADSEQTLLRNPVFASRGLADLPTQAATGNRGAETRAPFEAMLDRPLASSERVGRYRLLEIIGRGGMGVVYRAFDETRGRRRCPEGASPHEPGQPASIQAGVPELCAVDASSSRHALRDAVERSVLVLHDGAPERQDLRAACR